MLSFKGNYITILNQLDRSCFPILHSPNLGFVTSKKWPLGDSDRLWVPDLETIPVGVFPAIPSAKIQFLTIPESNKNFAG